MTKARKSVKYRWSLWRRRKVEAEKVFAERHREMQENIKRVQKDLQAQVQAVNALDLVIVMDCTSSMSPWIEQAKASVQAIIDGIRKDHPRATVRVGFVAYRDFCDGEDRLASVPLTTDADRVRKFISQLTAEGGGDEPEDIAGGLEMALAMDFKAPAKRVVLVADSPCHGAEFHNSRDDCAYRAEIAKSPCMRQLMRDLATRGIDFTIIEIRPTTTAKMVAILRSEFESVLVDDGLAREFRKVKLNDPDGVARFCDTVVSSASDSISATKMASVLKPSPSVSTSRSRSTGGVSSIHHYGPSTAMKTSSLALISEDEEKNDECDEEEADEDGDESGGADAFKPPGMKPLDWSELEDAVEVAAVRHSYHFRQGADVDWANIDLKHSVQETTIKLLPWCFAKGAMRSAHAMYDMKMNKRFVAKVYYGNPARSSPEDIQRLLRNDVKTQVVAKKLATDFTLLPQLRDGVDFIFTSLYEIKEPVLGLPAHATVFTAEPYIEGSYKKYNNNNGWINEHGSSLMRELAQTFSHFTWQHTLGHLMVVDLQGVGCIFTDPQIHSVDRHTFGRGNLSSAGMAAFFCTHKCNELCADLELVPFKVTASGAAPVAIAKRAKAHKDGDDDWEDAVVVERLMTCSCPLCGSIIRIARQAFIDAHTKSKDVFCDDCMAKVNERVAKNCSVCDEDMLVSAFWYDMKGMAQPSTCKKCKMVAAKTVDA